MKYVWTVD